MTSIHIPRSAFPALCAMAVLLSACGDRDPQTKGGGSSSTRAAESGVREIASPAAPGSAEPNLAAGPDGRVYLSWIEPAADSAHTLRFSVLEGERWSAPRTVASGGNWFVNWADFPSLEVMANNTMAAHWLQRNGSGKYTYDVRVAVSRDGGATWTPGVVPHTDGTASEHGFVSMWPERGDSVGLVWLDGRKFGAAEAEEHGAAGEMTLRTTRVGPDGRAAPDQELDGRVCDCCQTGMAVSGRGPVVAYRDRSPTEVRDIYVTRYVDGAWTPGRPVHDDGWVMPACPVNGPQVAADGDRVAVAWYTGADSTAQVRVAFSGDAGATFGAPARVDEGNPEGRVDVVMLADGAALVSWVERVGEKEAAVRVRRVGTDGRMGAPRTVAGSSSARASGFPRMVPAGGGVVFAWTAPGEPSQVRTARMPLSDFR